MKTGSKLLEKSMESGIFEHFIDKISAVIDN